MKPTSPPRDVPYPAVDLQQSIGFDKYLYPEQQSQDNYNSPAFAPEEANAAITTVNPVIEEIKRNPSI